MNKCLEYLIFIFGILLCNLSDGQEYIKVNQEAFGLDEKPGNYLPDTIKVVTEDSVTINLMDIITRPTLLSFVYYECPTLCPKMLEGIAEMANYTEAIPDVDYQIVTISIDYTETPTIARQAKDRYTSMIEKDITPYFWRFFTADSLNIRKLTDAVGYEFRQMGDDFVHTTSSVLITPEGMVSQYFYGTYFNYMHFAMGVEQAKKEIIVPTRLKTLKYCYNYQPEKNQAVVRITKIFGIGILIVILGLYLLMAFGKRNSKNEND